MTDIVNKDVELEKFVLDVVDKKSVDFRAEDSIVDANVSQTIEGASTITVTLHDQKRNILRAAILESKDDRLRAVDSKLDGFWWRLVKVSKSGDDLTLTFEEREVAYLRTHKGPRKAARDKITRAQFVLLLVKAVKRTKIKTIIPELKIVQPIGEGFVDDVKKPKKVKTKTKRDEDRARGFTSGVKLKGKEGILTKDQLKNADIALQVAEDEKAGPKATLALVEACIIEAPDFKNPVGGDGTSSGILQLTDIHKTDRRDVANVCRLFLTRGFTGAGGAIKLAAANPGRSAGWVAQETQGSGHPERYDTVRSQAKAIVDAWNGGSGSASGGKVRYKKYEFKVAKGETYWTAIQRLAQEVKWRAFVVKGKFYFISEERLYKQRAQYFISESTPGVNSIDFDWDTGKKLGAMKISCRIDRWAAPPGTVIIVEDSGPANGRWLVVQIDRSLFSANATITLNKAMTALAEPLGEQISEQSSNSTGDSGASGDLKGNAGERALAAAKAIHSKHYPYVWGGGHPSIGVPSKGPPGSGGGPTIGPGYDCSGGAAAVLKAAGIAPSSWKSVPGSGDMAASYGVSGEGESLTLWANAGHVFLEAKVDGKTYHLGTGNFGKGWSGFGVNPNLHTHSGFTPRHWPGT